MKKSQLKQLIREIFRHKTKYTGHTPPERMIAYNKAKKVAFGKPYREAKQEALEDFDLGFEAGYLAGTGETIHLPAGQSRAYREGFIEGAKLAQDEKGQA